MSARPVRPPQPSRESVTTIRSDGARVVLHPADVRGRWTVRRRVVAAVLLLFGLVLPWIRIGGQPAVFLDVVERRFHFFGTTFAAQDLWMAFFVVTGLGFSLYVLTAIVGRLWCGWTCPQTLLLEHVFRPIERLIDGDAPARRRLENAPWTGEKIARRAAKHAIFLVLSAFVVHAVLAYFVSLPGLWELVTHSPLEHAALFGLVVFATGLVYFDMAWFREQLCLVVCPYGRLQSALIDDDTRVVGYDAGRGEPRGAPSDPANGACIDCRRCVQVCPTGIDIRQGLQIECLGCTACIDACDEVMDKLERPRGLVRFDSLRAFAGEPKRFLRPRLIVYGILMLVGAAVAGFALASAKPADVAVTRMPGPPWYVTEDGLRNQYQVRVLNKSNRPMHVAIDASAPGGEPIRVVTQVGGITLAPYGEEVLPLVVLVPRGTPGGRFDLEVSATFRDPAADAPADAEPLVLSGHAEFLRPPGPAVAPAQP